jgi:hypothetical protein
MSEEDESVDATTYAFNWQTLNEYDYEGFLKWALIHLLTSEDARAGGIHVVTQLEDATDGFTDVRLRVEVNGTAVDPSHFLRAIHSNMAQFARTAAVEELERLAQFTELRSTLTVLQSAAIQRVEQVAKALGLDLDVERLRGEQS